MSIFTKKLLAVIVLFSVVVEASADRGVGRKNKNRPALNIAAPSGIKNSIPFNLKTGLTYKGSLLSTQAALGNSVFSNSLVTYQKGNITYIIPYKTKITLPDVQQGYTGVKLIIRNK